MPAERGRCPAAVALECAPIQMPAISAKTLCYAVGTVGGDMRSRLTLELWCNKYERNCMKFWVRPEREQPCFARRQLEQQRQQHALRQSQQQQPGQRQQQHWVPLCEGDSGGGGWQHLSASSGRNARVHGLPQCPERKPTGRSLFSGAVSRGTNKHAARGLVTARTRCEHSRASHF